MKLKCIPSSLTALVVAAASGVHAQGTQNIPIPADSVAREGVAVVAVTPMTPARVSSIAQAVVSQQPAPVVGATFLGVLSAHHRYFVNRAPFPLFVMTPAHTVGEGGGDNQWERTVPMTAGMVPPGARFFVSSTGLTQVTALANNATWAQVGFRMVWSPIMGRFFPQQ